MSKKINTKRGKPHRYAKDWGGIEFGPLTPGKASDPCGVFAAISRSEPSRDGHKAGVDAAQPRDEHDEGAAR